MWFLLDQISQNPVLLKNMYMVDVGINLSIMMTTQTIRGGPETAQGRRTETKHST